MNREPGAGLVERLVEGLAATPCINDHSHVIPEAERLTRDLDALSYFTHPYPAADLYAAGISADDLRDIGDASGPLEARWRRFEPYWRRVRLTGFSQCLLEGWRAVFGIGELTADTVGPLSERIREARRPGHYAHVLRQRANIAISLLQMEDLAEVDRSLFLPMPRLNRWTMLRSRDGLEAIERDYGVRLATLDDLVGAIGVVCRQWREAGAPAVKLSQSYHRPLDFRERQTAEARRVFDSLREGDYPGLDSDGGRVLEDFLVFAGCRAAAAEGLPVQFHVGPRAGVNGSLEGATAAPLTGLIRGVPEARFDLSHSGFPYLREAAVLAKTCASVYLNLSWIHIYSPVGTREALAEWLRMVPWNKILGFGDDLYWVDTVLGHLIMARRNVAWALGTLVEEGLVGESEALEIGRALFYDNPTDFYGLRHLATD
jgi:predicted TIM-barrel fold metal-dependent hydrolase